jgi:hypothetical protein
MVAEERGAFVTGEKANPSLAEAAASAEPDVKERLVRWWANGRG